MHIDDAFFIISQAEMKMKKAIGDYWLTVVMGGAEPQDAGEIAWIWFVDSRV